MRRSLAVLATLAFVVVAACGGGGQSPGSSAAASATAGASTAASDEGSGDAPAGGPTMTDETLGVEPAVTGLTEPTGIAFLDDEEFFVIEKSTGEVHRVIDGDPGEPVLDLAVNFFDERGLLGIALHPDFAENGWTYLFWTASGEGEGEGGLLGPDTDEETAVPELGNRVDRFVWDGSQLTWDRTILEMRSNTLGADTTGRVRGNHDGGQLAFGTDGTLFAVIGDQNLRGELQNIEGQGGLDAANWAGIVARVNDDGSIPDDNPFVDAASQLDGEAAENLARTWAYGIRNSFGLAVHPETGDLWQTENGDDSWDEVNILPGGANSGWWQLMGPAERFDQFRQIETESEDGTDVPDMPPDQLAESADAAQQRLVAYEGSQYVDPVFAWAFPPAVTSIALVTNDALGESSTQTAWLGSVLTDSLYRYPLAEDGSGFALDDDDGLSDRVDDNAQKGDLAESEGYVVGTGFGIVTHIVQAPSGLLYVASLDAGTVYRVGPAEHVVGGGAASSAPSAAASGAAASGGTGEVVEITIGTDPGSELVFDPTEVTVPAGATVRLTFVNESDSVPHNLSFGDPINAATATTVQPGEEETIDFVAPEPGEYTYVCTLHPGMEGTLIVEG